MNDIRFPTSLGVSTADTITLMVANLPRELIGTVLSHLLVVAERQGL